MPKSFDRDRTRTCNPQIRSLVPYPLGHTTSDSEIREPDSRVFCVLQTRLQACVVYTLLTAGGTGGRHILYADVDKNMFTLNDIFRVFSQPGSVV